MSNQRITDNLDSLFEVLPQEITKSITNEKNNADLIEVILDLGRIPIARLTEEELELTNAEVTRMIWIMLSIALVFLMETTELAWNAHFIELQQFLTKQVTLLD